MLIYFLNRGKTQKISDKAVDDFPGALKFLPMEFITIEMVEKFPDALKANDDIVFFNEDFSKVTFFVNQWLFLV